MQNQSNTPLGQDPNTPPTNPTTSTKPTSGNNSGESVPQQGETVVNEQEQNKPVNQEEFIDDANQHTLDANKTEDDGSLPAN